MEFNRTPSLHLTGKSRLSNPSSYRLQKLTIDHFEFEPEFLLPMASEWSSLEPGIVENIGHHLDIQDTIAASMMCRNWKQGMYRVPYDICEFKIYTVAQVENLQHFVAAHKEQLLEVSMYIDTPVLIDLTPILQCMSGSTSLCVLEILGKKKEYTEDNSRIDMSLFPKLPNLKRLMIEYSRYTGEFTNFCQYYSKQLRELRLICVSVPLGETWNPEYEWSELEALDISQSLYIVHLIVKTPFKKLAYVNFTNNGMMPLAFRVFMNNEVFLNCEQMYLSSNHIYDNDLALFVETLNQANIQRLRVLDISWNQLTTDSIDILVGLHKDIGLARLNIAGIDIKKEHMDALLEAEWLFDMHLITSRLKKHKRRYLRKALAKYNCSWDYAQL